MFLKSLELTNFQSHKSTKLDFVNGFNCIRGTNRSGKSAIFRALSCLLFNEWDGAWIRVGETECSITAVFDSFSIQRIKGEKVNKVIVTLNDGKILQYENFGIEYPDDIKALLSIPEVSLDSKTSVQLNMSNQDNPLFAIGESGLFRSKMFGGVSKTQAIDEILGSLKEDRKKEQQNKEHWESRLEAHKEEIRLTEQVLAHEPTIRACEEKLGSLQKLAEKFEELKNQQGKIVEYRKAAEKFKASRVLVEDIKLIQDIGGVVEAHNKLQELRRHQEMLLSALRSSGALVERKKTLDTSEHSASEELKAFKTCPTCGHPL